MKSFKNVAETEKEIIIRNHKFVAMINKSMVSYLKDEKTHEYVFLIKECIDFINKYIEMKYILEEDRKDLYRINSVIIFSK